MILAAAARQANFTGFSRRKIQFNYTRNSLAAAGRHRGTKFRFPCDGYNCPDHLSFTFLVEIIPPVKESINLAFKLTNSVPKFFT